MSKSTLSELKEKRNALNEKITNHKPFERSAAISKVRTYATEQDMTEDDLFPAPTDPYADFVHAPESEPDFDKILFSEFRYTDTFSYTFIADLEEQRDKLDEEIRAIHREAIQRVRAFISEYKLTKRDIYPTPQRKA